MKCAQEVAEVPAAQEAQPGPASPSPGPARVNEAASTQMHPGYSQNNTQGRKGKRLPRIHMAFWPENYAWIKQQSSPDHTMTEIVNELIDRARRNSFRH